MRYTPLTNAGGEPYVSVVRCFIGANLDVFGPAETPEVLFSLILTSLMFFCIP